MQSCMPHRWMISDGIHRMAACCHWTAWPAVQPHKRIESSGEAAGRTDFAPAHANGLLDEEHAVDAVPAALVDAQREVVIDEVGAVDVQHAEEAGAAGPALWGQDEARRRRSAASRKHAGFENHPRTSMWTAM